jgi:hypothetical protein
VLLLRVLTILTATEPEPWLACASDARYTWADTYTHALFESAALAPLHVPRTTPNEPLPMISNSLKRAEKLETWTAAARAGGRADGGPWVLLSSALNPLRLAHRNGLRIPSGGGMTVESGCIGAAEGPLCDSSVALHSPSRVRLMNVDDKIHHSASRCACFRVLAASPTMGCSLQKA